MPKETKPTSALSGRRPIARRSADLRNWISSSMRQVSSRKRKTGDGLRELERGRMYSTVVYWGYSSPGKLVSEMAWY